MRVLLIIAILASGCSAQQSEGSIDLNVYEMQWGFYKPTADSLLAYVDYKTGAEGYEGEDVEGAAGLNFYIKNRDGQKLSLHKEFNWLPHTLAELRNASGLVSTYIRNANLLEPGDVICSSLETRKTATITLNGGEDFERCSRLSSNVEVTEFDPIIRFHLGTVSNFAHISYELFFGNDTERVTGEDLYNIKVFLSGSRDGTKDEHKLSTHIPQIEEIDIEAGGYLTEQLIQTISKANTESHRYLCFTLEPREDIFFDYDGELTYCEAFPVANTTCRLWGDPHQKTFDGYGYTFQGECEYIAVETCKNEDEDLEDFRVIVDNFRRRPSRQITYIRELRLEYNGVAYALIHPNEVTVNGVKVTLPFQDSSNGVFIHYAAPNKILKTNFGLTIRLDAEHNGDITLSNYYKNKVCGLCGNFDDDRTNECHYRNGENMNERNVNCTEKHTKEWFVEGSCDLIPPTPPPDGPKPCDKEEVRRQVQELCSYLTDPTGPFAACHATLSPELYAATCEYDGCELFPETEFQCKSMDMYYYNCQSLSKWKLDDLLNWRKVVKRCPPVCPEGMYYNPSGDACPPSCAYPNGHEGTCPFPHTERCECPYGMLFDGVKCVSSNECGCTLEDGTYLSQGDAYVSEDCTVIIECIRKDLTRRTEDVCAENAECTIKDGRRDCYCEEGYKGDGRLECNTGGKTCHIYGDPHFDTFDKWHFSFQGDCTYIATRTCKDLPDGSPPFEVLVETGKLVPTERFTWMTAIILVYGGKTYKMSHTGAITVDDVDVRDSLPFEDKGLGVGIVRDGDTLVLNTEFGLTIRYDGRYDAIIDLPPAYEGKVCGLCGNADGLKNDKKKPDGTEVTKKLDFANSWGAFEDCPVVLKSVETCVEGSPEQAIALDSCRILLQKDGPLAPCFDYRDPLDYYNSCIFDLCGTLPSMEQLCNNMEQYVLACRSNGGALSIDWKSSVADCKPVNCPEGYTLFQRSCYKYFPDPKDFESAKTHCQSQCAHLVTITSTAENEFIGGFAENKTSWIGAERNLENPAVEMESSGEDVYTFLPIRLPKDFGSFKFSVQTEGDAHLILSSFNEIDGDEDPLYHIVLGGKDNPTNTLSRCLVCEPEDTASRSYVKGDQATTFYVTIKGTVVEIGRNYQRRILSVDEMDRIMDIRHVAFRTDGAPGTWKFFTSEFDWITKESWTGFNGFRMGEPSNYKNQENCLETNFNGEPGVWNDRNCRRPFSFVCEVNPGTE